MQIDDEDPDAVALLERLRKRRLWTYHPPPGSTTYDSIIPIIDSDARVRRGEFVIGILHGQGKGHFDSLVSTGPGAFRDLRQLSLPGDVGLHYKRGELLLVEPATAERVWIYLLANDRGLPGFLEALLADKQPSKLDALLNDPKRILRPWHRNAIDRAIGIANESRIELSPLLLFAAFLREAELRPTATTFAFVLRYIEASRISIFSVLGLSTLEPPEGPRTVNDATIAVVNRFMSRAHEVRKLTDGTRDIHTRHVAAAFLLDDEIAARLPIDVPALRLAVFEFIRTTVPSAKIDRWRKLLVTDVPQIKTPPEPLERQFSINTIVSRDTWTIEDKLGYALYAQAITESILNDTTKPPLTIGIQAPWGQGKTSLMRMIQEELDEGAPSLDESAAPLLDVRTAITTSYQELLYWSKQRPAPHEGMLREKPRRDPNDKRRRIATIWFNPLYYRETSQVWAGMAHAILHQLVNRFDNVTDREKFWFRLQQSRVNVEAIRRDVYHWLMLRFVPTGVVLVAALALTLLSAGLFPSLIPMIATAGVGTAGVGALLYRLFKDVQKPIDRPFEKYVTEPNYQTDLGLLHLIDHDLDRALQLLVGREPIAVFIDDLDRCDPQTVNQVILAINQFLSLPRRNVFFFLGMDMEMVAAALEQAQKELLGAAGSRRSFGWRFMEKFVQLPFVIPHLDETAAQAFAEAHLGGTSGRRAEPAAGVEEIKAKVEEAVTPTAVGKVMADLSASLPAEAKVELQKAASSKVSDLMKSNESDEMKQIAAVAVQDLDLNPRAIVRYFCLVRVLRNIQISTGHATDAESDRTLVLRAAHLLMNWPQFVQWLRNEPQVLSAGSTWKSTVDQVERLARGGLKKWQTGMAALSQREQPPPYLTDPTLYRYLHKLATGPPGLKEMYEARMF